MKPLTYGIVGAACWVVFATELTKHMSPFMGWLYVFLGGFGTALMAQALLMGACTKNKAKEKSEHSTENYSEDFR